MGVPVIVLEGANHVSRVGVSQLRNLNMHKFIAKDKDDYINIAVELASSFEDIGFIRKQLRRQMESSVLTDALSFTRNLEDVFLAISNN